MEVIAKTFTPLWRAKNGFKFQHFRVHKILFTFDNREDVDWILGGELWSFDKHLVVMSRYENESPLQDIKFDRTTLWVQAHGIPIKYMTIEAAKKICSVVGEVFTPTDPKLYDGGHFICVLVSIDLSLPLCRGRLISIGEGKQVWISFKYEGCQIYVIGVVGLLTMIETVSFGLTMKAHLHQNSVSLDLT